jgi:uncharacterized protein (DUF736 family)
MDRKDIGALWIRQSKKGEAFLSGVIELNGQKIEIIAFQNRKEREKHPDWKIYLSERRDPPRALPARPDLNSQKQFNEEDIPF